MAKFKTVRQFIKASDDSKSIYVMLTINVNVNGIFSMAFPDEAIALFKEYGLSHPTWVFQDDSFTKLEIAYQDFIKQILNCKEVRRCDMIDYGISTYCNYVLSGTQGFVPNRSADFDGYSDWKEGTTKEPFNGSSYGYSVYVKVYTRVYYEYANGDTHYKDERSDFSDPNMKWLLSLTRIRPSNGMDIKSVEYTPERALFFVNVFKSIFATNEKIKDLALDSDKFMQLIDSNTKQLF